MIPVGHHFRCCCFDEIGHRKIELEEIFYVCRQMHDPPCKCLLQSHLVLLTAGFWTIYSLGEPFMGHGNWERFWMENGRSRGWAVLVLAVLGSRAASTRTVQPR